jgi:threonine dehydrogenase-like Zn-dependent dehydrogenase
VHHTTLAFWLRAPGEGEIRTVDLPAPGPDDVVVRTRFSAVSRGTETLVFRGGVPASQHARMRAPFQVGEFPAPVEYGYLNVGEVEDGPAGLVGKTVFCLAPHRTRYVVPAGAVTVVPDAVPAARAVLAGTVETAVNALWDAAPRVGDRIAVIGGGMVGCCVAALLARIPGCGSSWSTSTRRGRASPPRSASGSPHPPTPRATATSSCTPARPTRGWPALWNCSPTRARWSS